MKFLIVGAGAVGAYIGAMMARQGYDCVAVDEHVADLERELIELDRELADLRARTPSGRQVEAEIHRIGEQTSTILLAAHDSEAHAGVAYHHRPEGFRVFGASAAPR